VTSAEQGLQHIGLLKRCVDKLAVAIKL